MKKEFVIVGTGLGGLSAALRLATAGHSVTMLEQYHRAGGRLNRLEKDGFTFDVGPSFMSMTYELEELFASCGLKNPVKMRELDPLYQVFFEGREKPIQLYKDLQKLQQEFGDLEPDFVKHADAYLKRAGEFFHDTEDKVVKSNFDSLLGYLLKLTRVPKKHLPYLFRTMWSEVEHTFKTNEARVIFSLVAFFLGNTPFKTPAIYSLLNYTEMRHNGYWHIDGGMYTVVEELLKLLNQYDVKIHYNTKVTGVIEHDGALTGVKTADGTVYGGDFFIINADAAWFRGSILNRKKFSEEKLDAMEWTLAPFTFYLGVKGKIDNLKHHNYFLGSNFKGYADTIFTSSISPQKPYYYVNVSSKTTPECAPEGHENIFVLCPVPDLRFKSNWDDKEQLADSIIDDLSKRVGYDIKSNIVVREVMDPIDWQNAFGLYRGSGLGLAHGMMQVGAFRPRNKDEELKNLYYVGASTTPGTGLPMVIISSRLVMQRLKEEYGIISSH